MRTLSAAELLGVWEQGLDQRPAERALTLLAAACPEMSLDALGSLCIGERDARLLALRESTFGSQLRSLASCPQCGERIEALFTVADIPVESEPEQAVDDYPLSVNGYELRFRLPNTLDSTAVMDAPDVATARNRLLERCLVTIHHEGRETSLDSLPETIVQAVVERMGEADPRADLWLSLACPSCAYQWQATFDIVSFFWSEINAWAYRTVREVHVLASAYGWRQADILEMSPRLRQVYLEMTGP